MALSHDSAVPDFTASCFDLTFADGIAELTLKRPEAHNSMTKAFWRELPEIIGRIDRAARARVIVIRALGKHFSAGMDLSVFAEGALDTGATDEGRRAVLQEAFRHKVKALQKTFSCLAEARIPVIAAIQGGCIGGAVDFATACDLRFASRDAYFVIQEINIGMTADVGTFPRLLRLIPDAIARELAFTGRKMGAEEAHQRGLVNALAEDAEGALALARNAAREIAARSPIAIAGTKRIINYAADHTADETLDYLALWQAGMFSPTDMAEAFAAKNARRPGNFPDLLPIPDGL